MRPLYHTSFETIKTRSVVRADCTVGVKNRRVARLQVEDVLSAGDKAKTGPIAYQISRSRGGCESGGLHFGVRRIKRSRTGKAIQIQGHETTSINRVGCGATAVTGKQACKVTLTP